MVGIASRNEKRAAPCRDSPSSSAAVIVTPARDAPGMSAAVCATPMSAACANVTDAKPPVPRRRSAHHRAMAKPMIAAATTPTSRNAVSAKGWMSHPANAMGTAATATLARRSTLESQLSRATLAPKPANSRRK